MPKAKACHIYNAVNGHVASMRGAVLSDWLRVRVWESPLCPRPQPRRGGVWCGADATYRSIRDQCQKSPDWEQHLHTVSEPLPKWTGENCKNCYSNFPHYYPLSIFLYLHLQLAFYFLLRFRSFRQQSLTGVPSAAAASSSPVPSTTLWTPYCAALTHWSTTTGAWVWVWRIMETQYWEEAALT